MHFLNANIIKTEPESSLRTFKSSTITKNDEMIMNYCPYQKYSAFFPQNCLKQSEISRCNRYTHVDQNCYLDPDGSINPLGNDISNVTSYHCFPRSYGHYDSTESFNHDRVDLGEYYQSVTGTTQTWNVQNDNNHLRAHFQEVIAKQTCFLEEGDMQNSRCSEDSTGERRTFFCGVLQKINNLNLL